MASLKVSNARIESFDTTTSTTSVIEITSLEASGLNLDGSPIPLKLALRIPGETAMDVSLEGQIAVSQESESVDFSDLDIVVTGATPKPLTAVLDGSLDLSRQVADTAVKLRMGEVRGNGKLRYASFESPQIDTGLKLSLASLPTTVIVRPRFERSSSPPTLMATVASE